MDKLKLKKNTTIKNYMNAVIVALQALNTDKSLVSKYIETRDKLNAEYSDQQATHKKSDTQEKNWVDFTEYVAKVDEIGKGLDYLFKKKEWSNSEKRKYQEWLLTKLYTVYQLRNDFVMKIVTKSQFTQLWHEW
eukprot:SAG31_NODE_11080_length_1068_cov_1.282766_1_plen_133_part_01